MNDDDKKRRRLILFWYYTGTELFSPEEDYDPDIRDGIKFLRTYHNNKYKKRLIDKSRLNKNPQKAEALIRLRLEVSQEMIKIDYQEELKRCISFIGLESPSTMDQIISRYKDLRTDDYIRSVNAKDKIDKGVKEIQEFVLRTIPDNPKEKFLEFIKELRDEGKVTKITDKSKSATNLKGPRKKDVFALLEKLEDYDFEPNIDELEMMNHQSFKPIRSSYLKKFRDRGFDLAMDILESKGSLPLKIFYELCRSPTPLYNKFLERSFIWYCTCNDKRAKGKYVDRFKNKKLLFTRITIDGPKKIKVMKMIKK